MCVFSTVFFVTYFNFLQKWLFIHSKIILRRNRSNNSRGQVILHSWFPNWLVICCSFIKLTYCIIWWSVRFYPLCLLFYDIIMNTALVFINKVSYSRIQYNCPSRCCWRLYFYLNCFHFFSYLTLIYFIFKLSFHCISSYFLSFVFDYHYLFLRSCDNKMILSGTNNYAVSIFQYLLQ